MQYVGGMLVQHPSVHLKGWTHEALMIDWLRYIWLKIVGPMYNAHPRLLQAHLGKIR